MIDFSKGMLSCGNVGGIQWQTRRAPLYNAVNGYVRLPEEHPWRDKDLQSGEVDVPVHGGITYGPDDDGWAGFDTLHWDDAWPLMPDYRDGSYVWTEELVKREAKALAGLVAAASEIGPEHSDDKDHPMNDDELLKKVARAILRTYHPGEEYVSSQDSAYAVSAAREAILVMEALNEHPPADQGKTQTIKIEADSGGLDFLSEEMVTRGAYRYWLESERDAEGDYPNREWEPDEREQFEWAARTVLEAALRG